MCTPTKRKFLLAALILVVTPLFASTSAQASDPFIAEIVMFGGNFAPRGWAFCDGQLLSISSNQALFSLVGTIYGGDGRTTFGLPDLRGRVPLGPRQGAGLSNCALGQRGGAESVALTIAQMPSHTHTATVTVRATSSNGNQTGPAGHILANDPREDQYSDTTPDVTMNSGATSVANANTGGSQAHPNLQPYLAINFIIAQVGVFPSRN